MALDRLCLPKLTCRASARGGAGSLYSQATVALFRHLPTVPAYKRSAVVYTKTYRDLQPPAPPSCVWGECQETLTVTDQTSCAHTGAATRGQGCPSPGGLPGQKCESGTSLFILRTVCLQVLLAVEKERTHLSSWVHG